MTFSTLPPITTLALTLILILITIFLNVQIRKSYLRLVIKYQQFRLKRVLKRLAKSDDKKVADAAVFIIEMMKLKENKS